MKTKRGIVWDIMSVFLFGTCLFLSLMGFYKNNQIISGGEGAYFLDYLLLFKNYSASWINSGAGLFSTSLNFSYVFHLIILQILVPNERILNFIMVYSIYFLPFLAAYLLLHELSVRRPTAFFLSVFYVLNPFSLIFLSGLNQWNVLNLYVIPAYLYIILHFYSDNLKLFLIFGLHSLLFAFTNANPPLMVVQQLALIVIVVFATLYKEKEGSVILTTFRKYLVVLLSFVVFNSWWLGQWLIVYRDAQIGYSIGFALSWLKGEALREIPYLARSLSLQNLIAFPVNTDFDFFSQHFGYSISPLLLMIPVLIIILNFFSKRFPKDLLFIMFILMISIFLSKGLGGSFGGIYQFLVLKVPVFSIFKSAPEKWGVMSVFLFFLALAISMKNFHKTKLNKLVLFLFGIYLIYTSIPFLTGNLISDYMRSPDFIGSRRFIDKIEYINTRKKINGDRSLYRLISFMGSNNYQVALHIEDNRYYTGNDPILSNTNKQFITPYVGTWTQRFDLLYEEISDVNYLRLYKLFNIRKIVINKDLFPWFGSAETLTTEEKIAIFDKALRSEQKGTIDIYDLGNYYLPRIYIPTNIIHTKSKLNDALSVISDYDTEFSDRSAISFESNLIGSKNFDSIPKISFFQINPAKYKIIVEDATHPYSLIFSESFHPGWKLYIGQDNTSIRSNSSQDMQTFFDGSINEIISKNGRRDLSPFETINLTPLPESKHSLINGYANSWTIEPSDTGYRQNYEIIIEFWPQRFYYLGLIITFTGVFVSLSVLVASRYYRKINV